MRTIAAAAVAACLSAPALAGGTPEIDAMIVRHAAAQGLPSALVHRVVKAESGYNPRASHAGNHGLMQIRLQTARGMGYRGAAGGLLDAETNLTYACAYLAGAYRAARGNTGRAYALYRRGYHGVGKPARPVQVAEAEARRAAVAVPAVPAAPAGGSAPEFLSALFGGR